MKHIIKLAIKGICVMFPMLAIYAYTWFNPLGYMDEESPHYLWNKEKVNSEETCYYDTIILGDSMANAAYMPEVLSDTAINLSLGGMTPVENYYVLQDWLTTHRAPQVCYLSFQDAHMIMEDCFWTRTMYSHRFRREQNLEILRTAEIFREPTIITDTYKTDFISYELFLPNKYIASIMNSGFNQRYEKNVETQKRDELHRGRYVARGADEFEGGEKAALEEFYVNPIFEDYYRRLIAMCVENGIQVRIVKLPHPENVGFTEEYKAQFHEFYGNLQKDYPEITVDWITNYDRKCFVDANHLNTYGALKLSSDIRALYPEDFGTAPFTKGQAEAVNDSILTVRRGEQLIDWICGRDYTLFLNDGAGVYSISGLNNREDGREALELENGLKVWQESADAWKWEEHVLGDFSVVVIDNYNQKEVCQKSFWIEKETCRLAE
ncbi:MAG: hypothetical protein HFI23_16495 [Lachnospiraceae bacterium]|nr:hypothetical protein [Lachnospiraceae bacterium]